MIKLKIGRNDPCYCGSGKKYKQCCMLMDKKDIYTCIKETVELSGYPEIVSDALCNMVRYIKDNEWMGACHATASVLYVIFSEMNYDVSLCIGEVKKEGLPPFDHSWISIDGKIIDIAVIMTMLRGEAISEPIVFDKNVKTKQAYDFNYGINTGIGLDSDTKKVMSMSFVDYMDAFPDEANGLWGVLDKVSPIKLDKENLRVKYKDTSREYICQ